MRLVRCFLLAAGVLGSGLPVHAATVQAAYALWLAGLPIGSADLVATVEGDRYSLQLQARLTGLAGAFTSGKGAATATGALTGGRIVPASFAVLARSGQDQRIVQVGLKAGTVTAVAIEPPLEEKPDRVPVTDAHKRGVIDPLGAILAPALARGDPLDPANCNRTLPVFDGAVRFDIVLSYAEAKPIQTAGYSGPALVCNVRYRPVAGHRAERPAVKFMEENRDMAVWLAPVEGTRVLMPVRVSVRTMIGTSVVEASRWSVEAGAARPSEALAR